MTANRGLKAEKDNFYRRAQIEALARQEFPHIKIIEDEDSREFFIANPLRFDDDLIEKLMDVDENPIAIARIHIEHENGEGSWDAFKAAGGQSWMVMQALQDEQNRVQGKVPGSGSPTR